MPKKKSKRRTPPPAPPTPQSLSGPNGKLLLAAALAICALPILLGLRLWSSLPKQIPSGFTGPSGIEDTISRWVVVFGFPVLMCVMDLVAYWELSVANRRKGPPAIPMRLLGRWGFPAMSAVFCAGMILEGAGKGLTPPYLLPAVSGLLLLVLASYILDTPASDAPIASQAATGKLSLAAGLLAIIAAIFFA